MAANETPKWVPPYIAFTTLLNLIERMHDGGGAPPLIDRSYLDKFSGGYQSQVIAALKSLSLIADDGSVTDDLTQLVEATDRETREPMVAALLRKYYPEPIRLGSIKATQGQLLDSFKAWGITGDTLRKAIAFYIAAAKYAKVPLSTNFKVPSVSQGDGRRTAGKSGAAPKPLKGEDDDGSNEKPRVEDPWQQSIEPAILEWLKRIPAKGKPWPSADRARWNGVLQAMLEGIYGEE